MRLWYRAEVERTMALDQSVPANQQAVVSILGLQGAVNSIAPAFDTATQAVVATVTTLATLSAVDRAAVKDTAVADLNKQRTAAVNAAYTALQNSVTAEKNRIGAIETATNASITQMNAQVSALNTSSGVLSSLFALLKTNIDQLYGQVQDTANSAFDTARAFITTSANNATSTGALPDVKAMQDALGTVTTGLNAKVYATAQDAARDKLVLAGELSRIQGVTGSKLSNEQQQIDALNAQIENQKQMLIDLAGQKTALDNMLANSKLQVDSLTGIDSGIRSIADALNNLAGALGSLQDSSSYAKPTAAKVQSSTGASNLDKWMPTGSTTGVTQTWASAGGAVGYQNDAGGVSIQGIDNTTFSVQDAIASVTADLAAGNPELVYAAAIKKGVSAKSLDALMGWAEGTANGWAVANNLPKFAGGGSYAGGMALVGENGPEMINFSQPGQVYNAGQTQNILSGIGDNSELVHELQSLRSEVSLLRAEARATAISTSKLNSNFERSIVPTTNGDALLVKTTV
jgi:hypothetical protein